MEFFKKNEIIELAVKIEDNGYVFYNSAVQRKDLSPKAVKFFTYVRDEELNHKNTFKELRGKIDIFEMKESTSWEDATEYIKAIVESHVFSDPQNAINKAVEANDEQEILKNAIDFEKDTLLFFHSIKKFVNEKTLGTIQKIIDEELDHILKLKNYK
ncbi:MAG: ferritin family protein [Candidatus Cloacimonetes bacterium]|nr:ferritin family protein [Candidatus Cloacimonadota bacterium]